MKGRIRVIRRLLKPHFVYRPTQVVRALRHKLRGTWLSEEPMLLPWGLPLPRVSADFAGQRLHMHGVVALEAVEAACRLLDAGETGIDVGANLGVVTSAIASRVGRRGRVISLEMMDCTYPLLEENAAAWRKTCPDIRTINCAASDRDSEIEVGLSSDFAVNRGVAYVAPAGVLAGHERRTVAARRLDGLLGDLMEIGFAKVDAERHELQVLRGFGRLLPKLRDIVVEDLRAWTTPVKVFLRETGFRVFRIDIGLWGPKLVPFGNLDDTSPGTDDCADYLATRDPDRALRRFAACGYRSLGFEF